MARCRFVCPTLVALVALASSALADTETPPAAPAAANVARKKHVVIDPGHGGSNLGAQGTIPALREKHLTLVLANLVATRLRDQGLEVTMTRTTDRTLTLRQRVDTANNLSADLFVSIHANAAEDPTSRGTETFFLALSPTDAAAERVAARENEAFGEAATGIAAVNDPFIALIGDLIATEHLQESSVFAHEVQSELAAAAPRSRGVKQALFVVLTGVQMPASLVEIGFITSREEEAHMKSADGLREIVAALERAIVDYGRGHAQRLGAGTPASPAEAK